MTIITILLAAIAAMLAGILWVLGRIRRFMPQAHHVQQWIEQRDAERLAQQPAQRVAQPIDGLRHDGHKWIHER